MELLVVYDYDWQAEAEAGQLPSLFPEPIQGLVSSRLRGLRLLDPGGGRNVRARGTSRQSSACGAVNFTLLVVTLDGVKSHHS